MHQIETPAGPPGGGAGEVGQGTSTAARSTALRPVLAPVVPAIAAAMTPRAEAPKSRAYYGGGSLLCMAHCNIRIAKAGEKRVVYQ